MHTSQEQIAPDVIQVLAANASANSLSINDYLRELLGLKPAKDLNPANEEAEEEALPSQAQLARLAVLQRIAERQANRPFTKSANTVEMLREARAGAMWGYEPHEKS